MDILKRALAPIVDEAWEMVAEEAARTLKANLSARRIVDVDGPHGFDFSSVSLGRLEVPREQSAEGVEYGLRRVLPLVELRVRFELPVWELDNVARGAEDIDLTPVTRAAERVARFEETAVYQGFAGGSIVGLAQSSDHPAIHLGGEASKYPDAVARARFMLQEKGIDGPYALVLGSTPFRLLESYTAAYPPAKVIAGLIEGPIYHSPFIEGGFLVSTRGGDMELTLGQDVALGYESHDARSVRLFLTESFTFRVLESAAVVRLNTGG